MFKITEQWLRENGTKGIGWTYRQTAVLNTDQKTHGWLRRLVGKEITDAQKQQFEQLAAERREVLASGRASRPSANAALDALVAKVRAQYPQMAGMSLHALLKKCRKELGLGLRRANKRSQKIAVLRLFLGEKGPAAVSVPAAAPVVSEPKPAKQQRRRYREDAFFDSREWKELRYKAIKLHGRKCMACGCEGGEIHVDHIKPRSKFPELALTLENLQILCADCNLGKGAWDQTDWRKPESLVPVVMTEMQDEDRTGAKLH